MCSTRNVELVRSLGGDRVIDYTREDFTRSGPRYDVILDLAGQHPLSACRAALTRTGTFVLAIGNGGPVLGPIDGYITALALSPFVTQHLRVLAAKPSRRDLEALTTFIEAGQVTPCSRRPTRWPTPRRPSAITPSNTPDPRSHRRSDPTAATGSEADERRLTPTAAC